MLQASVMCIGTWAAQRISCRKTLRTHFEHLPPSSMHHRYSWMLSQRWRRHKCWISTLSSSQTQHWHLLQPAMHHQ
eukprot:12196652-Karenia_brevis.AAC.1